MRPGHRHGRFGLRRRLRHPAARHFPAFPHSLLDSRCGEHLLVTRIDPTLSCGERLRELGIFEGAEIVVIRCSDPMVVLAKDSRIAVDPLAAARVEVSRAPTLRVDAEVGHEPCP